MTENEDNDPGKNQNARIIDTPKTDGTYRLVATSLGQAGVGAYTITVREFVASKN